MLLETPFEVSLQVACLLAPEAQVQHVLLVSSLLVFSLKYR